MMTLLALLMGNKKRERFIRGIYTTHSNTLLITYLLVNVMRYAVFSDLQGNLEAVARFFKETQGTVDAYLCLGDIVQDGTSFDENRLIDLLRSQGVVAVQGNHDAALVTNQAAAVQKIDPTNIDYLAGLPKVHLVNRFQLVHAPGGMRILDEHDARNGFSFLLPGTQICFYGHSHKPAVYRSDISGRVHTDLRGKEALLDGRSKYLVNPGGIGLKWGEPQTFMVYDSKTRRIELKQLQGDAHGGHS